MQNLKESVFLCARASAMVLWLLVGSSLFAAVFALLGGSALIERWVVGLGLNSGQFFWLALFIIFMLGWPLEWTEITIIFLPLFLPLLDNFGIDPLFFGIMVRAEPADVVPVAAGGDVGVLPEGRGAQERDAEPDLQRHVPVHGVSDHWPWCVLWFFPQLATALPEAIYGIPLRGR